jgi:hypothetical protein
MTQLDSGADVSSMSDAVLRVRYAEAWNLSNMHDLRVLADEARRRSLPCGVTASPVAGSEEHFQARENPGPTLAEIRRHGEVAGSQHAVGWIQRNSPGLEELESAYVTAPSSIGDVARREARDKWYGGGRMQERRVEAYEAGYVDAWRKELSREMGRQRQTASNPLEVGRGAMTEHLRLHHFHGSLRITDLTNAGKRGKKVRELVLIPKTLNDEQASAIISQAADAIMHMTYPEAVKYLEGRGEGEYSLDERELRGIDVEPPGTKISLEKKFDDGDVVKIDASPHDFMVVSSAVVQLKGKPHHRQDTLYYPMGRADGIAFYGWLKENVSKAANMTMNEIRKVWDSIGVRYNHH